MKQILITGASSGIGLQLAQDYLFLGYKVIACGRDINKLKAAFGSSANNNLRLCCFNLDEPETIKPNTLDIKELDTVILNAGTCEYIDDAVNFDAQCFERVIKTNLIGTGYCLQSLTPKIKPGGTLAIISSSATYLPFPRAEAYGTSKAGIDYLAHCLAIDLMPKGIHVCLVRPGFVDTPLTQKNGFTMPGIINKSQASQYIIDGIDKGKSEISFPKVFVSSLSFLSILPRFIWRKLALKMVHKQPASIS